jgi:hypothetical protein
MKVSTLLPGEPRLSHGKMGEDSPLRLCLVHPPAIPTQIHTRGCPAKRYAKRILSPLQGSC